MARHFSLRSLQELREQNAEQNAALSLAIAKLVEQNSRIIQQNEQILAELRGRSAGPPPAPPAEQAPPQLA